MDECSADVRMLESFGLCRQRSGSLRSAKDMRAPTKRNMSGGKMQADRFIANRRSSDLDAAHFKMFASHGNDDRDDSPVFSNTYEEASEEAKCQAYHRRLSWLTKGRSDGPLLSFSPDHQQRRRSSIDNTAPPGFPAETDDVNGLIRRYQELALPSGKPYRNISHFSTKLFEMPQVCDDFYYSTLDWSVDNTISVALGLDVFSWNVSSQERDEQQDMDLEAECTLLRYQPQGHKLAVGLANGDVQLWNVEKKKVERTMVDHNLDNSASSSNAVTSFAWHPDGNGCLFGNEAGHVIEVDMRCRNQVNKFNLSRNTSVSGMALSADDKLLATGGNDGKVTVWSLKQGQPMVEFTDHQAAVKAVAWCPWRRSVLASAGGLGDGSIRLWKVSNGIQLGKAITDTQITSMVWSAEHKELATGHGGDENFICLWRGETLKPVTQLKEHRERVLHMALSPDGITLASLGADEMLLLWKCFEHATTHRSSRRQSCPSIPQSPLTMTIR